MCQGPFCQSLWPATLTKFRLQTCQMFENAAKGKYAMLLCGPVGNFLFKENGSKVKTPTEKAYMNPGPDPVPQ